jgi:hypothetical protein
LVAPQPELAPELMNLRLILARLILVAVASASVRALVRPRAGSPHVRLGQQAKIIRPQRFSPFRLKYGQAFPELPNSFDRQGCENDKQSASNSADRRGIVEFDAIIIGAGVSGFAASTISAASA